jgi:hypothetical protein
MYVAFKCFMLQAQATDVGVHEGGKGQAAAADAWKRRRPPPAVWGRRHKPHGAVVEETGMSLPGGLEGTDTAPMWKRQGRVIQAT